MKLIQCSKEHFYDSDTYSQCPHCAANPQPSEPPILQKSFVPSFSADKTEPLFSPAYPDDDGKTIAVVKPVPTLPTELSENLDEEESYGGPVGWLMCVQGPCKGRDYRIFSERNFVGRHGGMEIKIAEDDQILLNNHCSIVFDPVGAKFFILPGEDSLTKLNGETLSCVKPLQPRDRIEAGQTTLVFVPYITSMEDAVELFQ